MSRFSALKGFKDLLPEEAALWRRIEKKGEEILLGFGYAEIRTPLLEPTELFARGIGGATDIVEKEMYTFEDWDRRKITLRPEGTASGVRAYLEHRLGEGQGVVKLFYRGPMFRHERPQAGRLRQFHQIGAEGIGSLDPLLDVEIVSLLWFMLGEFGIDGLTLEINSLGCSVCRPGYREALVSYLTERASGLCEDCRRRLKTNPLRVLDCKKEECRKITEGAPASIDFLCEECGPHFKTVQEGLGDLSVSFRINRRLVRGLDYYTKTAFEVTTTRLGAQNAVAAGGRYDDLVETFGGPPTAAIGFAVGLERVIALLGDGEGREGSTSPPLFIAALGEAAKRRVAPLLFELRKG
ncbi:MAG TPA: histidine--tRNA ligase, partial [Nitrospiria bacterium]|nr:histidine--tRNA ligase [Nitrospiria bacterium]